MVVVANKADLEHERQVGTHEGQALAKHFGCRFIETSAKQRMNVDEAFHDLVREIRRYNKVYCSPLSPGPEGLTATDSCVFFALAPDRSRLLVDLELPPRPSRPSSKKSRPSLQDAAPVVSSFKSPVLLSSLLLSRLDARPITIFSCFPSFPHPRTPPPIYTRGPASFTHMHA